MKGRLIPVADLSPMDKQRMYRLLASHFLKPTMEQFQYDLHRKDWAVLVEDQPESLCGFTTLLVWDQPNHAEKVLALYSGDTILAREAWNTPVMWNVWAAGVNHLRKMRNQKKLYWFFVTCAYRSYRFLPVLTQVFYPRYDAPTPGHFRELMDRVGARLFGDTYDGHRGIVALNHSERLRPDLLEISPARLHDPHVAYFHRKNPGRERGEALLCVAELSPDNLTPAGRRILARSANSRCTIDMDQASALLG